MSVLFCECALIMLVSFFPKSVVSNSMSRAVSISWMSPLMEQSLQNAADWLKKALSQPGTKCNLWFSKAGFSVVPSRYFNEMFSQMDLSKKCLCSIKSHLLSFQNFTMQTQCLWDTWNFPNPAICSVASKSPNTNLSHQKVEEWAQEVFEG